MPGRMGQASLSPESKRGNIEEGLVSSGDNAASAPDSHQFNPSTRLGRAILLTVLGAFVSVQVINVLSQPPASFVVEVAVGVTSVCVLGGLQVFISTSQRVTHWPTARRVGLLVAQGLVTYLPLLALGNEWGGMAGWLAGSCLLLLSGRTAWALFGAVVLSMLLGSLATGQDTFSVAYLTVATLDIGLVVFGMSRLSGIIHALNETRAELAELAVMKERMRFSRDLHDLLGYSLSAITLKAELARRLAGSNPARARDEIAELLDIAHQALADVRLVSSSYRNMSLSKEATTIASMLSTVGIRTTVEINCGPLEERVDTALATTLREAITNMIRHASAQNCTIEVDTTPDSVRLRITNDGAPSSAVIDRCRGGLENIAVRMEAVGGQVTVNPHDGIFEILATAPVSAATRPDETQAAAATAVPDGVVFSGGTAVSGAAIISDSTPITYGTASPVLSAKRSDAPQKSDGTQGAHPDDTADGENGA